MRLKIIASASARCSTFYGDGVFGNWGRGPMAMALPGGRLIKVTQGFSHLSRRSRRWLALLLLPALILRAGIPAGFMLFPGLDGAYLGFCPGSGALPPAANELATHASHSGHIHHPGGAPSTPGPQHHPSCVFSTGATTTFAATLAAVLAPPVLSAPAVRVASLIFLPAILRSQSSRAPPVLA